MASTPKHKLFIGVNIGGSSSLTGKTLDPDLVGYADAKGGCSKFDSLLITFDSLLTWDCDDPIETLLAKVNRNSLTFDMTGVKMDSENTKIY